MRGPPQPSCALGLAGCLGRCEPSWQGTSILIYSLGSIGAMQRELAAKTPPREVGQERPGQPQSADFLGHEAYFPISCPRLWGISGLGACTRSALAGQGLRGCQPCNPWTGSWLTVFPWNSSKK